MTIFSNGCITTLLHNLGWSACLFVNERIKVPGKGNKWYLHTHFYFHRNRKSLGFSIFYEAFGRVVFKGGWEFVAVYIFFG